MLLGWQLTNVAASSADINHSDISYDLKSTKNCTNSPGQKINIYDNPSPLALIPPPSSLVIALDSFCFRGGRGKINLGIGSQTKSAQMPNGYAEYKSVKDAPSVFLKEGAALIFNGFPCILFVEAKFTWERRFANFAAGNHWEKCETSSEGSCHHRYFSAESRLFLCYIDKPACYWLNSEVQFSHRLLFASVDLLSAESENLMRIKALAARLQELHLWDGRIGTTSTENKTSCDFWGKKDRICRNVSVNPQNMLKANVHLGECEHVERLRAKHTLCCGSSSSYDGSFGKGCKRKADGQRSRGTRGTLRPRRLQFPLLSIVGGLRAAHARIKEQMAHFPIIGS